MSNSPSEPPSVDDAPILHVDIDAFFASVEVIDHPDLVGRPVAVGGSGDRGVIASASYVARGFGVRSAMATVVARRICPELVVLPGRFDRYEEYSRRFHAIVGEITPDFEPLGLDEVFADLRSLRKLSVLPFGAARTIRERVSKELGLRCAVGVGRNKLFAKLASKAAKPRVVGGVVSDGPGVIWVSPELERKWLAELPVRALWGVGPATAEKLRGLGLNWVRDLASIDEATLAAHVGPSMAAVLAGFAVGEDARAVVVERAVKSLGHEQTFARSLRGVGELSAALKAHAAVVARSLRERAVVARTLSVVVRYDDWTNVTRSQTLAFGVDDEYAIYAVGEALVQSLDTSRSVRLLGVHASNFLNRGDNAVQLSFGFETGAASVAPLRVTPLPTQVEREALRDALDEVRRRFGRTAVATLSELGADGIDVATQRGRYAFGPSGEESPKRER